MNTTGQHGRQPTPQAAPLTDPRIRNMPANSAPTTTQTSVTEAAGICRDYIWGICSMKDQCIYRHDLEFEAMKETLKFCHDHQNRTGCTRPDCTYLHTSRDEENLFLTTGQIPRVLLDRYSGMSYVAENGAGAESGPPPTPVYEYIAQPPPPPPPPPVQSVPMQHSPRQKQQQQMQATLMISPIQGPMQSTMNGAIQGPMPCPIPGPMQGSMPGPMPGPMQSPIQGSMPSPSQGPKPGPLQGPMPGPLQGPMPGPLQGPMPGPLQGPMPGPLQGPMPGPLQGPMPGPLKVPMQGHMHHPMQGPMTGSTLMPQMSAPMPQMAAPMPQMAAPIHAPPPPPPPTSSVSTSRMSGPAYTGGHHGSPNLINTHYQPTNNQQQLPAVFDPTKPPPPIFQKRPILKRSAENCEAGPSKLRKSETSDESSCENCEQQLLRLELYIKKTDQVKKENEIARKESAVRAQDLEQKKKLVRSIMSPEVYRISEEFMENGTSVPSISTLNSVWSDIFSTPSPFQSQPSPNNSIINSLLGLIVARDEEPTPATSDAALLQQLTSRLRPTSTNGTSTDFLTSLLEMMRKSPTEKNSSESRSLPMSIGNGPVRSFSEVGSSTVRSYEGAGPSSSRPHEGAGLSSSRPYEGPGPSSSRPYEGAGPSSRPYEGNGPSPSRPYDGAGPSVSRPYEGTGPSPSRPYDGAGPSLSRPYEGTGPSPSRPYDGAGPSLSRPYDGAVASTTYTEMSMAPYEPVRYPPPTLASTAPAKGQYHTGMEMLAMPQGVRPVPSTTMHISGPGPYGSQQTHLQVQGPPSRPPFYVQMPPYNGVNPPYPGMMPQPARPSMQPPQNPPNNFLFGTRYPNYYPPYQ